MQRLQEKKPQSRKKILLEKTVKVRNSSLRIPKPFMDHLKWDKEGEFCVQMVEGKVIIYCQVKRCAVCKKQLNESEITEMEKLKLANLTCKDCCEQIREKYKAI